MSRPKNKKELVELSNTHYTRLLNLVDSLPEDIRHKEFPEGFLNRNVRDVLAHLHHWHLMMMDWYKIGMAGDKPDMPAPGYTWRQIPELNREIQQKYRNTDLGEVRKLLDDSFHVLQEIIGSHNEEELFEKKRYEWTGSTSLGAYLISNTSSHYDWARKLILKCTKPR